MNNHPGVAPLAMTFRIIEQVAPFPSACDGAQFDVYQQSPTVLPYYNVYVILFRAKHLFIVCSRT